MKTKSQLSETSQLEEELLQAIIQLNRTPALRRIAESMRGEGFVLQFLARRGEDALPSELSSEMEVSTARVAAALNSLEEKILIHRRIDKEDRRRIRITLTEEGRDASLKYQQVVSGDASKLLELLGEEDARELIRIATKLNRLLAADEVKEDK